MSLPPSHACIQSTYAFSRAHPPNEHETNPTLKSLASSSGSQGPRSRDAWAAAPGCTGGGVAATAPRRMI